MPLNLDTAFSARLCRVQPLEARYSWRPSSSIRRKLASLLARQSGGSTPSLSLALLRIGIAATQVSIDNRRSCPRPLSFRPGLSRIYRKEVTLLNSAGDIVFECLKGKTHVFVSEWSYDVDFLEQVSVANKHGCYYIGTLYV